MAKSLGVVRSPSAILRLGGGKPWGERNVLRVIPSSRAFAFICATNVLTVPPALWASV
jgi:hypothetical protein